MFEDLLTALSSLLSYPNIFLVLIGTAIGMTAGAIPGLNAPIVIALMLPLTYGMDLLSAMAFLLAINGGATFGGSIPAIVINTPGTSVNIATTLDGYPMAKQGRAGEALGASATASLMGALFGLLVLILFIPIIRSVVMLFGPPEFFLLATWAILVLALLMKGTMLDGLIAGTLGLVLSFVGFNPVVGGLRFTFGTTYLWDGVQVIPVFLGLYGVAEAIALATQRRPVAGRNLDVKDSVWKGVRAVFTHWKTLIRSSATGTLIGMVPVLGGTVASIGGYLQAKQMAKDQSMFGRGDVRGVIGSECANNAKDGGALMPTLALGVPGSEVYVIMLGAFLLHGIQPGRSLFTEHMDVVWILILSLIASNFLVSTLGLVVAHWAARITVIPGVFIGPVILMTSLVGAFALRGQIMDSILTLAFGLIGYVFNRYQIPRIVFIMAFVLGPIMERSFFQAMQISGNDPSIFVTRPVSAVVVALIVLTVAVPFIQMLRAHKQHAARA